VHRSRVDTAETILRKAHMLVTLAVILLILAVVGGIAIHPLLFLLAVLAVLVLLGGGRRGPAL